jgi:carbonic anhydrase
MTIIDDILARSTNREDHTSEIRNVPFDRPEMLLIGCVDARKDPIGDLGIPKGKALILRNIAALIRGTSVAPEQRETESAALEFAIKVMKVKHVVVMGHTDCGGIRAAIQDLDFPCIKHYLSPLDNIKAEVRLKGGSLDDQAIILEREAVIMSVKNLRSYGYIAEAQAAGKISLHGWIINIVTGKLEEII